MIDEKDFPDGMILIQKVRGVKVYGNCGRFSEEEFGFSVQQPIAGFVKKQFWEGVQEYQNIKIVGEHLLSISEGAKWKSIMEKYKRFTSTITEFNILVGINPKGEKQHRRTICELGKNEWEQVVIAK
jgi:hypothetical protein